MISFDSCAGPCDVVVMDTVKIFGDVVVTGGAGAIGSRLVRELLKTDVSRVWVVDDLSSGYEWLLPTDKRLQFVQADVCSIDTLSIDCQEPTVFQLAAFFANQNSVDHPIKDLHTNGQGTLSALMWAKKYHAKRFVYASAGCSIAGHDFEEAIREDMPVSLHLDTPYQITKALGEFYCNYYSEFVPTVRCRFFNSYGPGEVPGKYRNVIPNFIAKALHDEPLTITGTGEETRDFIYVDDLVAGLLKAATVDTASGEAINLGTGRQTKIFDLAKLIIEVCGSKSQITFGPRRSWDKSLHREADLSKAKRLLGFDPQVTVPEGIVKTVEWFNENLKKIF